MIISHKHKFIFIKTKKTAGTSIETALSKICGAHDIISPITPRDEAIRKKIGKSAQNYFIPFKMYNRLDWAKLFLMINRRRNISKYGINRRFYYNHMSAVEIRNYIEPEVWNNYYKFCFERNPFDKVLSHYHHRIKRDGIDFKTYVQSEELDWLKGFEMYTSGGNVLVDKIYKYEELDQAIEDISEIIGCKVVLPEVRVKGQFREDRRHYSEVIEATEREKIEIYFAREMKLLGYSF